MGGFDSFLNINEYLDSWIIHGNVDIVSNLIIRVLPPGLAVFPAIKIVIKNKAVYLSIAYKTKN